MERQSSVRKQPKFSRRILCSKWRILRSPMLNKHPAYSQLCLYDYTEMYPECVIASWDTLILLLDAENIERSVQLDAEKKSNVYANYKLQEKIASHNMQLCVS